MIKEVLKVNIDNALIRIPKGWIEANIPSPNDVIRVLREIDEDRIIITIPPQKQPENDDEQNG